jgi:hypothetical protein
VGSPIKSSRPDESCLPAFRFVCAESRKPQLAAWCARCDRVHIHGDNGGGQQLVLAACRNHSAETYRMFPMGQIASPADCPRMTIEETERLSELLRWAGQLLATLETDQFWEYSIGADAEEIRQ